jgi:hypothetical protein
MASGERVRALFMPNDRPSRVPISQTARSPPVRRPAFSGGPIWLIRGLIEEFVDRERRNRQARLARIRALRFAVSIPAKARIDCPCPILTPKCWSTKP